MASPFAQPRPARIRIETDSSLAIDAIVPCFFVVYPNPDDSRQIQFATYTLSAAQLAELIAAAIRYATAQGVMNQVMQSLTTTSTKIEAQGYPPKPPGTPPDDMPPHLRGR